MQLRYVVFHGPARLVVKGGRGVRVERAERGRIFGQDQLVGFSTDFAYSVTRTETFWPYFLGREQLLKDRVADGVGVLDRRGSADGRSARGKSSRGNRGTDRCRHESVRDVSFVTLLRSGPSASGRIRVRHAGHHGQWRRLALAEMLARAAFTSEPSSKLSRSGAQGRNRTTDTVIFSHVLYQLSYLGMSAAARKRAPIEALSAPVQPVCRRAAGRSGSAGGPGTR